MSDLHKDTLHNQTSVLFNVILKEAKKHVLLSTVQNSRSLCKWTFCSCGWVTANCQFEKFLLLLKDQCATCVVQKKKTRVSVSTGVLKLVTVCHTCYNLVLYITVHCVSTCFIAVWSTFTAAFLITFNVFHSCLVISHYLFLLPAFYVLILYLLLLQFLLCVYYYSILFCFCWLLYV